MATLCDRQSMSLGAGRIGVASSITGQRGVDGSAFVILNVPVH